MRSSEKVFLVSVVAASAACSQLLGIGDPIDDAALVSMDSGALRDTGTKTGAVTNDASANDASTNEDDAGADAGPVGPAFTTLASGLTDPNRVTVDTNYAYVSEPSKGDIVRCSRAGCTAVETVVSAPSPTGMAISGSTLFFATERRYIKKCSVTTVPCNPEPVFDVGLITDPSELRIRASRLYWVETNNSAARILTCPVSGCSAGYPKILYTSVSGELLDGANLTGLALDGTYLYVATYQGYIVRFTMSGDEGLVTASATGIGVGAFSTSGFDLDGETIRYNVILSGSAFQCAAPDCATATEIKNDLTHPVALVSNSSFVYGIDNGSGGATGSLWRLRK